MKNADVALRIIRPIGRLAALGCLASGEPIVVGVGTVSLAVQRWARN